MLAAVATIAIGCTFSTAAAETVEARVYTLGSDYFSDRIFDFKCKVVPTDGSSASFYAACTREQANDLGGGEGVTLDIGLRPAADMTPEAAATADRLQILSPQREIIRRVWANMTTPTAAGPARSSRLTAPGGPRSILIILVNYVGMEVTYATEASARLMMQNPGGRSVDGLYRAASYDRLSWPEALTTVITVNSPRRGADLEGCDSYDMAYEADRLANQRPDVNTADFNHTVYLIPDQIEACRWCGQAQTAGGKVWVRSGSGSVLAHELGHNLGMGHAATDPDDDGVVNYVYGDKGSIMGWALLWTTVNAAHREQLGYIGEGNGAETYDMDCAAQSVHSQRSMTISRLGLAPGPGNLNPNMVRIARHPTSNYILSFKALADWDGVTADVNLQNRLQIHTHDGSNSETQRRETLLVKALADGETFTGAARAGDGSSVPLYITVTNTSADTVTVTIDTGCPTTAPTSARPVCADANEHCDIWRDNGYCLSATHDRYMHTNCRASCGLCPGSALPTPPLNPVVTTTALVPSTATPNIAVCHHALCGAMSTNQPVRPRCANEHDHCAEHFERHEVRCCSDTLKPGWRKHTDQCPWTESDNWNADVTSCQHSKTFDEAEAFCMGVDARLCTRAEIQTNCVRATGCGHDMDLVWSSHADVIDRAVVAANIGYATASGEPETETDTMAIGVDQQIELAADTSATTTDDDDNSNGAAIALAILVTLGVVTALTTILYVRQQRQKSNQLEDDNARPLDLLTAGSSANPPALSLRMAASEDEVFQLSPDGGHSIRLESVQRGNPLYCASRRPRSTDHEPTADLGPLAS